MSFFRNLLIDRKRKPYYCEVEYLESTGTQYIDTGIDIGAEIELEFSFYATAFNGSTYCSPLSARRTNLINSISYAFNNGTTYVSFGNNAEVQVSPTIKLNTKHVIIQNKEGLWQDGNKTTYAQGYNTNFTETGNLYVFARNNIGSGVGNYFIGRIYYVKITEGSTLVRNFIPVLDWDMRPCMYDKVTRKLFYNKGTGVDFLYGREIHEVEYLESTGTQYINTGIYGTEDLETELICQQLQRNSESNGKGIFGTFNSTTANSYYLYQEGSTNSHWQVGFGNFLNTSTEIDLNKHTFNFSNYKVYMDGVVIANLTAGSMNTTPQTLLLFNLHNASGGIYDSLPQRFYRAMFVKSGVLIGDFIPAIDENGVGYMFDRVSHTIFDNAGKGNFNYPPIELEYLEATKTQYINTGVVPTSSMNVKIDFYVPSTAPNLEQHILGAMGGAGSQNGSRYQFLGVLKNAGDRWRTAYGELTAADNNWGRAIYDEKVHFDVTLQKGTSTVYINNSATPDWTFTYEEDVITTSPIYMFALNNSGTTALLSACRVYSCSISHNGTLLRDFIPVFYNGSASMWDKVNNIFYPNAGTGSFVAGKILESRWF